MGKLKDAIRSGSEQNVSALLRRKASLRAGSTDDQGNTPLMLAASLGRLDSCAALVDARFDVNAANNMGYTALMMASEKGFHEIVDILAKRRADVNAAKPNGSTALMIAAANGHDEVIRILLENGALPGVRQKDDEFTALMFASQEGHKTVVQRLVAARVDVNASHKSGWTALTIAARHGHPAIVDILCKNGANVDENQGGWSPFLIAVQESAKDEDSTRFFECADVLLKSKADINLRNGGGLTSLQLVAAMGSLEATSWLLERGADASIKTKDNLTAQDIAKKEGFNYIAEKIDEYVAPEEDDGGIFGFISSPDFALVKSLSDMLDIHESSMMSTPLVRACHLRGNPLRLIFEASGPIKNFQNPNSLTTKLCVAFTRLLSRGYLATVFGQVIFDTITNGVQIETDVERASDRLAESCSLLTALTERIVSIFTSSLDESPPLLRQFLSALRQHVSGKLPLESFSFVAFLRFLFVDCLLGPAIAFPDHFQIIDRPISPQIRRSLSLLSNALVAVSKGVPSADKSLACVDFLAEKSSQAINKFLLSLCNEPPPAELPPCSYPQHVLQKDAIFFQTIISRYKDALKHHCESSAPNSSLRRLPRILTMKAGGHELLTPRGSDVELDLILSLVAHPVDFVPSEEKKEKIEMVQREPVAVVEVPSILKEKEEELNQSIAKLTEEVLQIQTQLEAKQSECEVLKKQLVAAHTEKEGRVQEVEKMWESERRQFEDMMQNLQLSIVENEKRAEAELQRRVEAVQRAQQLEFGFREEPPPPPSHPSELANLEREFMSKVEDLEKLHNLELEKCGEKIEKYKKKCNEMSVAVEELNRLLEWSMTSLNEWREIQQVQGIDKAMAIAKLKSVPTAELLQAATGLDHSLKERLMRFSPSNRR